MSTSLDTLNTSSGTLVLKRMSQYSEIPYCSARSDEMRCWSKAFDVNELIESRYITKGWDEFGVRGKEGELRKRGASLVPLLIDPSIALNQKIFEELLKFIDGHTQLHADPWALRTAFSKSRHSCAD